MPPRYNPDIHHRHSIRLRGYDYAQAGVYFITICTQERICHFGSIQDGQVHLNANGQLVEGEWLRTAIVRRNVVLDAFTVMPNHFHGIIVLIDQAKADSPTVSDEQTLARRLTGPAPGSLGAIIAQFKSMVTKQINRLPETSSFFAWQRNYFERVIRSEDELNQPREYIATNPMRWANDQ